MLPQARSCVAAAVLISAMLLSASFVHSQTFGLEKDRIQIAELSGLWRFHPGDDADGKLGWADPHLDDSGWKLIRGDNSWNAQGFPKLDGFAWYRARVDVLPGQTNVAIYIPRIVTSYQVFADGKLLGGEGGMPPHPRPISEFNPPAVYPLPQVANPQARTVLIAIRVWHWPGWDLLVDGGFYVTPLIGQTVLLNERRDARTSQLTLLTAQDAVLAMLEALAGLASLGFFWLRPREREYLWFSIFIFASAWLHLATRTARLGGSDALVFDLIQTGLGGVILSAQIALFYRLLGGRRGWLLWTAIGSGAGSCVLGVALFFANAIWGHLPQGTVVLWNAPTAVFSLAPAIWVLLLLSRRAIQGLFEARLLLAPVALLELAAVMDPVFWLGTFVFRWNQEIWSWYRTFTGTPFPISVSDLCETLFLVGRLAFFVRRFTRTSLQEEAHRRELESARVVQLILIPEAIPHVSGFAIESVYKPAGEVGGDFFQILPSADGGLMAVIGDVSGKGAAAAMTVSLLVGTVRTLAHYTQSPGEILAAMNRRMLGRSQADSPPAWYCASGKMAA